MKIKISKDRSVFPYRTNVSNQYENKTDSIEFDLDVPNGNKYLFVEIDGKTVPYPLINPFPITSGLSWMAGGHRACVVVSNVEIKDTINKEDTLFISDEFMLVVAKNFINPNDVSQDALPEPLKIVYDDLMSLKKELENKLSNGDFNGDSAYEVAVKNGYKGTEEEWIASLKGEKGDKGEPYNHSEEFQQLALQVERKATDAENAAQSALESKTSALQGATSALEASESAKQSALSASGSAQSAKEAEISAKEGAKSALQSANSAKESATSASQGAVSAEQAKGYAEQAKVSETNAKTSETNSKASELNAKKSAENIKASVNDITQLKSDFSRNVGKLEKSVNILDLNDPDCSHEAYDPTTGGASSSSPNVLVSGFIPFDFNDTFCYSLPTDWYSNNVVLYDSEKRLIVSKTSFENGHKVKQSNALGGYVKFHIDKSLTYEKKWENAKFVKFSFWKDNADFSDLMIVKGDVFPTEFIPYKNGFEYSKEFINAVKRYSNEKANPLANKIILFSGDSVCAGFIDNGDGTYGKQYGWAELIKENNPTCIMKNYGQGGTTMAIQKGKKDSILERLDNMHKEFPNADYIILEGGVNDCYQADKIKIGTISEGYDGVFDTSTFCGALEQLFKTAILKWKGKKIGYIVLFKVPSAVNFKEYMDKAKQICEKWSIPYIDLYKCSGLEFNIDEIRNQFSYGGGGLHPNVDGYKVITPKIEAWIKNL